MVTLSFYSTYEIRPTFAFFSFTQYLHLNYKHFIDPPIESSIKSKT